MVKQTALCKACDMFSVSILRLRVINDPHRYMGSAKMTTGEQF